MWHYLALLCCALCSLFSATYSHATLTIDENFQHAALGTELNIFVILLIQLTLEEVKEKLLLLYAKPKFLLAITNLAVGFDLKQKINILFLCS